MASPLSGAARWLALGDSYTVGEGVAGSERWPERVAERLRSGGAAWTPPRVLAATGWITEELLAVMARERVWPVTERFALVSLMVGVNDQYRGRDAAAFTRSFGECLERAVALAGDSAARVVVVSIPDWGVTPFAAGRDREAIARDVDAFNAIERARVGAAGAHWCDVTALSRRHGSDPAFLAADGLHPGPAAYAAWAELLAPVAGTAMGGRAPTTL